jgi:hypothetical protein
MPKIVTASWFAPLPPGHVRVGISRSTPRRMAAGYRVRIVERLNFRKLQPGPWFNSVPDEEYDQRYAAEVLAPLDPHAVAAHLQQIVGNNVPVLCCFEATGKGLWCHRALAAEWLAAAIGEPVPELGYDLLPQHLHPMMPRLKRLGTADKLR